MLGPKIAKFTTYDINFREFEEKIFFASINFRESLNEIENFGTKNG